MVYRRGEILGLLPQDNVKTVLQYKNTDEGFQFLIEWTEQSEGGQSWLNAQQFGPAWSQALKLMTEKCGGA